MVDRSPLVYDWNPPLGSSVGRVRVEDDTRDALQKVGIAHPTSAQRKGLLSSLADVGVQVVFLGFPAASQAEASLCRDLVAHISEASLPLEPILMARANRADVTAIARIQDAARSPVTADLFISSSRIRHHVEGWSLADLLDRLGDSASLAAAEGVEFRIAFEDSTRTTPDDLRTAVETALALGPTALVLNDTVGTSLPAGVSRHVDFARGVARELGSAVPIAWHGHNDQGMSLANALAAIEAGAELISGTVLGLGERSGNTPLEQLIWILATMGSTKYDVSQLPALCQAFAAATGTQIPRHQPLVGADVFATSTGTHVAALLKARALDIEVEDQLFSGVSARSLQRSQRILLGPGSGRAAAREILQQAGLEADAPSVELLLGHCRRHDAYLESAEDVRRVVAEDHPR